MVSLNNDGFVFLSKRFTVKHATLRELEWAERTDNNVEARSLHMESSIKHSRNGKYWQSYEGHPCEEVTDISWVPGKK